MLQIMIDISKVNLSWDIIILLEYLQYKTCILLLKVILINIEYKWIL